MKGRNETNCPIRCEIILTINHAKAKVVGDDSSNNYSQVQVPSHFRLIVFVGPLNFQKSGVSIILTLGQHQESRSRQFLPGVKQTLTSDSYFPTSYEFMTSMARRVSHRELPRGLTPALTLLAPALRDSRGITEVGAQVGRESQSPSR